MFLNLSRITAVVAMVAAVAVPAAGQSVGQQLSALLTTQGPMPDGFVQDAAAAEATFRTVAGLLQVELTTLPTTNSAGGFVYRLNPALGTVERATNDFGPFFTERAMRSGARQLSMGLTYQTSSFGTLQGADLGGGTFPTNLARFPGAVNPITVDQLSLDLETRTTTGFAHYGVSDLLDIGVLVPVVNLRYSGTRVTVMNGQSMFRIAGGGSTSGLGDVTLTARYRLPSRSRAGIAFGSDVRLPTGREEDLLGAGEATVRALVIGSWEGGRFAVHTNGAVGAGGASGELSWGGALSYAPAPRLTIVGELLARRFNDLHRVADVYEPHSVLAGVETMRWLPEDGGVTNAYTVAGLKWNVSGSMVLNGSILVRLTDAGLRAKVTPAISIDYAFDR